MLSPVRIVCVLAVAMTLAGCHRGQDVTVEGHSITLHAHDAPAATITSSGNFSVGRKNIELPPDQRALLKHYYSGVVAVRHDSDAIKSAGMAMAGQAVHQVGHALHDAIAESGSSADADKKVAAGMQAGSKQIQQTADRLCRELHEVQATQASLAAQVGAFKPYAQVDVAPQVHCGL